MRTVPDRLLDDLRPQPLAVFDRILVPTDGSPASRDAVDLAVRLAAAFETALRIVSVIDREKLNGELTMWSGGEAAGPVFDALTAAATATLRDAHARARDAGVEAETAVLAGNVVEEVLLDIAAWRGDLIVVGSHAHAQAFAPGLGGKTAELLRKSTVPVLVVR